MGSFLLSLLIFMVCALIGGISGLKIPKISHTIPEPIIELLGFAAMIAVFCLSYNRLMQIIISLLIGLIMVYLLDSQKEKK